jgi:DNA-binding MarR family transcriptional regulator
LTTKPMPAYGQEIYRQYLDAVVMQVQASAEAAGLNTTDWHALSVLGLAGRLTAGELAERTGLTTGATTRLIDRLERAGHARRVTDPADRRRVNVEPMPGSLDLDRTVGPARRLVGEVFAGFSPQQLETLFEYFRRATPAFRKAADEIRTRRAVPPGGPKTSSRQAKDR